MSTTEITSLTGRIYGAVYHGLENGLDQAQLDDTIARAIGDYHADNGSEPE